MAQVFRGAAAQDQHRLVVVDADVVEGQVGLGGIAGLLDVGVPAGLEVVDDEVEATLAGRRDARGETGLGEALARVQGFEALAGVAGDDQDCSGHARLWDGRGSSGKRGPLAAPASRRGRIALRRWFTSSATSRLKPGPSTSPRASPPFSPTSRRRASRCRPAPPPNRSTPASSRPSAPASPRSGGPTSSCSTSSAACRRTPRAAATSCCTARCSITSTCRRGTTTGSIPRPRTSRRCAPPTTRR